MKFLLSSILVLGLAACGGGYNPDKDPANNAIELGSTRYFDLGEGRGLMTEAPTSTNSAANFEVSFLIADQGTFTLTAFSDSKLEKGLNISFQRQGTTLVVTASAQGQTQDWSPRFASIDPAQEVTLSFDIHNNERPAHLLIWKGPKNSSLNHRNTIYNSGEDSLDLGYDASPGNGSGRFWGFQTINSQIIKAQISSPQDQH